MNTNHEFTVNAKDTKKIVLHGILLGSVILRLREYKVEQRPAAGAKLNMLKI